jgi:hypothetical protein
VRRGLGCKPRSAAHKLARFGLIHALIGTTAGVAPTFAPTSDLTPHCPYRLDQGRSSACGGHAPAIWVATCASIAGISLGFTGCPSPWFIYATARCQEDTGPTGSPLADSGVEPADPINALADCGIVPMSPTSTPDGRCSDVWTADDVAGIANAPPPNVGNRPTAEQLAAAAKHLVVGAYVIDPAAAFFCELIAATLTAKKAVAACIFVDTPFEDWGNGNPPETTAPLGGKPNTNDPNGGGHYVTILAHKTLADGSLAFLIVNSWGESWGCGTPSNGPTGCIWVSGAWLAASASEAYGLTIETKAAA